MNITSLIGRVVGQVETRYTESGMAISRFTIAVDRDFKKEGEPTSDFIRCVAFSKQGEFAEKYLKKGIKIGITGRIQTGSYKDKDGKTVYTTDIVVSNYTFCQSKQESDAEIKSDPEGFMQIPDGLDAELPFV